MVPTKKNYAIKNDKLMKHTNKTVCTYWIVHLCIVNLFVLTIYMIDWLIDCCLTSSEQFFSYIQDENI
jgi:hypothetical protein